ncbi:MAG TPA: nucleotidyltransferase domain-containing protein [Nitrospiraceae bacterium]|nr:nucleotidyltransferase domain-containing protein [Nitrospiraceae bacterium]
MSNVIDVPRLEEALRAVPAILFSLLFGSGRNGHLPKSDSDIDVAVYLDHNPDVDERLHLLGLLQDAVQTDRVDLIFLNVTENVTLQREALKGRILSCRDPEAYATFFSLADRRGRDEEDRIARAWAMRRELSAGR